MNLVDKATQYIALKHDGQYRRGLDIPYSTHLYGVARVLKTAKYSDQVVIAGLLHDILEDSDATVLEIEELFGAQILQLVKAVSEPDKSIPWKERKQKAIEKVKELNEDEISIAIAEKIQNLNAMAFVINNFGENAWYGESAKKLDQRWFYEHYYEETKKYHPTNRLLMEFEEGIQRLISLT